MYIGPHIFNSTKTNHFGLLSASHSFFSVHVNISSACVWKSSFYVSFVTLSSKLFLKLIISMLCSNIIPHRSTINCIIKIPVENNKQIFTLSKKKKNQLVFEKVCECEQIPSFFHQGNWFGTVNGLTARTVMQALVDVYVAVQTEIVLGSNKITQFKWS